MYSVKKSLLPKSYAFFYIEKAMFSEARTWSRALYSLNCMRHGDQSLKDHYKSV